VRGREGADRMEGLGGGGGGFGRLIFKTSQDMM
jgi:hypothetical protein